LHCGRYLGDLQGKPTVVALPTPKPEQPTIASTPPAVYPPQIEPLPVVWRAKGILNSGGAILFIIILLMMLAVYFFGIKR